MKRFSFDRLSRLSLAACVLALPALVGCGKSEPAVFRLNLQGRSPDDFRVTSQDKEEDQKKAKLDNEASLETVSTVLYAMFGSPDDPYVMPETGLDQRKIELASGRVGSNKSGRQRGLYRQHCAHCHGISGDGAGPTAAFLNPYPRDYRTGTFKFKSTARAAKPTTDDMRRILHEGIAGTAMPSFLLLPDDEIDSLVEYVKYLSMRGQTETLLLIKVLDESDPIDLKTVKLSELASEYLTPVAESSGGRPNLRSLIRPMARRPIRPRRWPPRSPRGPNCSAAQRRSAPSATVRRRWVTAAKSCCLTIGTRSSSSPTWPRKLPTPS